MKTKMWNAVGGFAWVGMLLALSTYLATSQVQGQPVATLAQPNTPSDPGPKFDLDFIGGPPDELIRAIERATGQPLNAIVPQEEAGYNLPAFKVRQVNVENLFKALETASLRTETYVTGTYFSDFGGKGARSQYAMSETSAGFQKLGNLWVFRVKRPARVPDDGLRSARFYQLEPFLAKNTIEDITTAIQTAWTMMGKAKSATTNTLKFHKETKLLIAVGEEPQLQVIDDVLKALQPTFVSPRGGRRGPVNNTTTNAPQKNQFE